MPNFREVTEYRAKVQDQHKGICVYDVIKISQEMLGQNNKRKSVS